MEHRQERLVLLRPAGGRGDLSEFHTDPLKTLGAEGPGSSGAGEENTRPEGICDLVTRQVAEL